MKKNIDANKSTGVLFYSKGIYGRQLGVPSDGSVRRLRSSDSDASCNPARFQNCEEKENQHWTQHPEAGFSDAIDHRSQNISYHQAAKPWGAAKCYDSAAITADEYQSN
jgi:hypothetical protein